MIFLIWCLGRLLLVSKVRWVSRVVLLVFVLNSVSRWVCDYSGVVLRFGLKIGWFLVFMKVMEMVLILSRVFL